MGTLAVGRVQEAVAVTGVEIGLSDHDGAPRLQVPWAAGHARGLEDALHLLGFHGLPGPEPADAPPAPHHPEEFHVPPPRRLRATVGACRERSTSLDVALLCVASSARSSTAVPSRIDARS